MGGLVDNVYGLMKEFAPSSREIMLPLRQYVTDIGKESDYGGGGTSKTVVDEIVQELFLQRLMRLGKHTKKHIRVNAEEDTPSKYLFSGIKDKELVCTVHIDPLDGTESYLEKMGDEFTSGYAISDAANNFTHTAIYAPAKRLLYCASPSEYGVYKVTDCLDLEPYKISGSCLEPNIIYEKRLLSDNGKRSLEKMGFKVQGMGCTHTKVLNVALGIAGAYLYGATNPHDSMVPYAFASKYRAVALKADGTPITGRDILLSEKEGIVKFERLPSVCYLSPNLDSPERTALLGALRKDENLSNEYRDYLNKIKGCSHWKNIQSWV